MSEHKVSVIWKRESEDFSFKKYNRSHEWNFGHGNVVNATAAPDYLGDPNRVDPEQGFVAALASCHMLTFLAIASQKNYAVDHYEDNAVGFLEKNEQGVMALTRIILKPRIQFGDRQPDEKTLHQLHESAHKHCFLANSVKTQILIE